MPSGELIRISKKLKTFLNNRRICPSETFDEVIKRLLKKRGHKI